MRPSSILVVIVVALAVAGCGGSAASTRPTPPASASPTPTPQPSLTPSAVPAAPATAAPTPPASAGTVAAALGIADYEFLETDVTVKVGTTVMWTNTGLRAHTVTSDDGTFNSGVLQGGSTFSHLFATAGTFRYHCTIHSGMIATVTVAK